MSSKNFKKESRFGSLCNLYVHILIVYFHLFYLFFYLEQIDSRSTKADDVPVICDVKRGSTAYRCGMIQPGDRLLSIDTHSLRGKSLNEIVTLLKNCDEIVRLKIRKDDSYAEDNLAENVVVYKVQLLRQG